MYFLFSCFCYDFLCWIFCACLQWISTPFNYFLLFFLRQHWFITLYKSHVYNILFPLLYTLGFPDSASGKESACQCSTLKRRGLDLWVEKILWSREWQLTPVFLCRKFHRQKKRKFHGQRSLLVYSTWGCKELNMTHAWAHTRVYTTAWSPPNI